MEQSRVCSKCNIEKPITDFTFIKRDNRYDRRCKQCRNEQHKANRLKHLEYYREKDREYYQDNRDKLLQKNKKYNEEHKDKLKEYKKEYAIKNKDKIAENKREYAKKNKDRLKEYLANYYQDNKETLKEKNKAYAIKNKDKLADAKKRYRQENIEQIRAYNKQRYDEKREQILEYQKAYRENNQDKIKETRKKIYDRLKDTQEYKEQKRKYREEHSDELRAYFKKYRNEHKEELRAYLKNKAENDPMYVLKLKVRRTIYDSFKRKNYTKNSHTAQILGCDVNYFISYLLETFKNNYGYDWDNNEPVQIDHIIPLAIAETEDDIIKLCHYTNLQLLKAEDNRAKSDKLDFKIGNK